MVYWHINTIIGVKLGWILDKVIGRLRHWPDMGCQRDQSSGDGFRFEIKINPDSASLIEGMCISLQVKTLNEQSGLKCLV